MLKGLKWREKLQFMVLAFSGEVVMYVLFCHDTYYDAFIQAMSVTNEEFGTILTVYGWVAVVGYIIGGLLADKVSPRSLMAITFLGTGILNIAFGFFPSYGVCMALFIGMGITTSFTYWAAMQKATRAVGRHIGSESKAFGFLQTGRDLFGIFVIGAATIGFNLIASAVIGLRFVIWWFGGWLIVFGIVSLFVFDKEPDPEIISTSSYFKLLGDCLKNVDIWLCTGMAFGGYAIGSLCQGYVSAMATSIFGMSIGTAATFGTLTRYLLLFGALSTAFIGERVGPSKVIYINNYMQMACMVALLYLFKHPNVIGFAVVIVIESILIGSFRCHKYATIREAKIPMQLSGSAFGFLAMVIYTSDAWPYNVIGGWLDNHDAVTAYSWLMYMLLAFGVVTIVSSIIFRRRNRQNIIDVLAEEKRKREELKQQQGA